MTQKFYVDAQGALIGSYDGPDDTNPYQGAAGSTEVVPPAMGDLWINGSWITPAPTKAALKQAAADKRWLLETGGLAVNGATIKTDRESQALITGACTLLANDPTLQAVDFKGDSGWVSLPRQVMVQIGVAVGRHVQRLFSAERTLDGLIDTDEVTTLAEIEAWTGWSAS